jgi:hypothetical protein
MSRPLVSSAADLLGVRLRVLCQGHRGEQLEAGANPLPSRKPLSSPGLLMRDDLLVDESLAQRLPLPLAQLYRRAHNAKTPLERHLTAFICGKREPPLHSGKRLKLL